jgi:cytochrome d ubiquinol oxidase subunit I
MELLDASLLGWSRAQFAMTAMYHWLFVPLTLGLGVIMAVMETFYLTTGKEEWKKATKFWMTLFGVNFAIGVATGIILEFEFGTNWSNYSWFVGDIFGAPLAIEGILAFFMEATFISIMFFGWNKVGKKFHLASTWLTVIGATLSALWILVANAWMQYPVGMEFNPSMTRNEMIDFWSILLSPVAINKFLHTVTSGWVLGSLFVIGISSWYLIKKREVEFALRSMKVAAIFGIVSTVLIIVTGDGSAYHMSQRQPMKLAAMEGLYKGKNHNDLVAFGILDPDKKEYSDDKDAYLFKMMVPIPGMLSYLAYRDGNAFVPGIKDIIDGGYPVQHAGENGIALSFAEKHERGKKAIDALSAYQKDMNAKDTTDANIQKAELKKNYPYFGYGYLDKPNELIPNVPLTFYSFHLMVMLGMYFLALFVVVLFFIYRKSIQRQNWLLWISLLTIPLGYLAGELGWVVAEVGRQPWAIQDVLPVQAAISNISADSVKITFFLFLILFTALLVAEIRIMLKQIKKGSESEAKH